VGASARAVLLGLVAGLGLVGYLVIRPAEAWMLWLTAGLVALAVDGTVRSSPKWDNLPFADSVVYVFLPALVVLGVGFFADNAATGYARPISGAAGAVLVGIVAFGEYHTVDYGSRLYGPMRLLLAVATYLTAFALYTVIFTRATELPAAALAVGLVSMALSMELLRESRLSVVSSVLIGLAVGVSIAEFRIALYFFALDGLLAGALLIIGFYLATGLVHHLLDHDLELGTTAEYVLVAAVATAAVVFTRVFV